MYAVVVHVNIAPVVGVWVGVKITVNDSPGLRGFGLPLLAAIDMRPEAMVGVDQLRPAGVLIIAEETEKPLGIAILAEPS